MFEKIEEYFGSSRAFNGSFAILRHSELHNFSLGHYIKCIKPIRC